MSSILDVLGAMITGSIILLMMFSALFNIQVISYNTQLQISLSQMSEDLITGRKIGNDHYLGLESFLSRVGAGVPDSLAIIEATSTSFKFLGRSNTSSAISTYYFVQKAASSPLYVYKDDMVNHISGPFWLADPLSLTYYDENENPTLNIADIRSIKVDITFLYNTYRSDIDKKLIKHNIVFWKYFKNLYL
ncbi:MAG: hypothetical protein P9M11_08730 [Candidatus Tenebribacter burtonii]|nr:hypothetical protein [Candidatus Tenebribacter burtonii]